MSTIICIEVYNDGCVQLRAQCNSCKSVNTHTITHACTKEEGVVKINFENLGQRACDNMNCFADYKLYNKKIKK